ncbi:MAG: hypothetical protein ACO3EE_00575 [Flavobacteriales bacterium]
MKKESHKTKENNSEDANPDLELNLNRMTIVERLMFPETFKEYQEKVALLIQSIEMYFSEKEILEHLNVVDIDAVLSSQPDIIKTSRKDKEGKFFYMDIAMDYNVTPSNIFHDSFFAYKLRGLDILKIDAFLDYQLAAHYQNDTASFFRFLKLVERKYSSLISAETVQTINEWIESFSKEIENPLAEKPKKGKVKREAQDKLTCLNQEQTVLLMYYLQKEKVLLKNEYLTDMDAGKAFKLLTGYSQHTLRQNLSKFHLYQNKANLKEIDNLLTRLKIAIDKDLKEK